MLSMRIAACTLATAVAVGWALPACSQVKDLAGGAVAGPAFAAPLDPAALSVAPELNRVLAGTAPDCSTAAGAEDAGCAATAHAEPIPDAPAPEPATWALMISGAGLVGAALRLRRRLDALSAV